MFCRARGRVLSPPPRSARPQRVAPRPHRGGRHRDARVTRPRAARLARAARRLHAQSQ